MQCLGNRKCNSASYSTADDACAAYPVKLGRLAERSDKIGNALALGFEAELFGSAADYLKYYLYRSALAVGTGNRKRNPLSVLIDTENYKLSRQCFFRYQRSIYLHHNDRWIQLSF